MPLAEIDIAYGAAELPEAARALLRDGESRAAGLEERSDGPPGFVPCRFARVVRAVADDRLAQHFVNGEAVWESWHHCSDLTPAGLKSILR